MKIFISFLLLLFFASNFLFSKSEENSFIENIDKGTNHCNKFFQERMNSLKTEDTKFKNFFICKFSKKRKRFYIYMLSEERDQKKSGSFLDAFWARSSLNEHVWGLKLGSFKVLVNFDMPSTHMAYLQRVLGEKYRALLQWALGARSTTRTLTQCHTLDIAFHIGLSGAVSASRSLPAYTELASTPWSLNLAIHESWAGQHTLKR